MQFLIDNLSSHFSQYKITYENVKNVKLPIAQKNQAFSDEEKELIEILKKDSSVKTSTGKGICWDQLYNKFTLRTKQLKLVNENFKFFQRKMESFKESVRKKIQSFKKNNT